MQESELDNFNTEGSDNGKLKKLKQVEHLVVVSRHLFLQTPTGSSSQQRNLHHLHQIHSLLKPQQKLHDNS